MSFAKHRKELEQLKEKDPAFYEELKKENPDLLQFGADISGDEDDSESSGSDEESSDDEEKEQKDAAASNDESDSGDDDDDGVATSSGKRSG